MMIASLNNLILAEGDWLEFLPFLIFLGISIIAGIAKNAQKKDKDRSRSSSSFSPRQPRREPRQTLSLNSLEKEEPEWVHIPDSVPPPIPAAVSKVDKFKTRRNEICEHPPAAREDSHVHREVSDAPRHKASAEGRTIHVDLMEPARLRQAMILHEVFSPPLALREERPLWDE